MQPIIHTAEQLRLLCSLVDNESDPCRLISWRTHDVIVSNRITALSIPLPEDMERSLAIEGNDMVGWLRGVIDQGEEDLPVEVVIEKLGDDKATMSTPELCASFLTVPLGDAAHSSKLGEVVDASIAFFEAPIAQHLLDSKWVARLGAITSAFEVQLLGAENRYRNGLRVLSCASSDSPVIYGFQSAHGMARYLVMPLRMAPATKAVKP